MGAKNKVLLVSIIVCLRDFKQIIIKYDKMRLNLSTIEKHKTNMLVIVLTLIIKIKVGTP